MAVEFAETLARVLPSTTCHDLRLAAAESAGAAGSRQCHLQPRSRPPATTPPTGHGEGNAIAIGLGLLTAEGFARSV
jgi:hypothetical protein